MVLVDFTALRYISYGGMSSINNARSEAAELRSTQSLKIWASNQGERNEAEVKSGFRPSSLESSACIGGRRDGQRRLSSFCILDMKNKDRA